NVTVAVARLWSPAKVDSARVRSQHGVAATRIHGDAHTHIRACAAQASRPRRHATRRVLRNERVGARRGERSRAKINRTFERPDDKHVAAGIYGHRTPRSVVQTSLVEASSPDRDARRRVLRDERRLPVRIELVEYARTDLQGVQ